MEDKEIPQSEDDVKLGDNESEIQLIPEKKNLKHQSLINIWMTAQSRT